jgi:hypothetical protein
MADGLWTGIPRELLELFLEFDRAQVRYLLVGGHAVAVHGRPRSTKDVDIWLDASQANVQRAAEALKRFGVPEELASQLRNATADDIVWLGRSPCRIDLLQTLPGVEFEGAWSRCVSLEVENILIRVIGKEDLIRNKQTVGRPQDRRDVRALLGRTKGRPPGR